MKNTFFWLIIFFSFFLRKFVPWLYYDLLLSWFCFVFAAYQFAACRSTHAHMYINSRSHSHTSIAATLDTQFHITTTLTNWVPTAVRHVVADSHRYCTRSLERSDECVSSGWVCCVCMCECARSVYQIACFALFCFVFFFFILDLVWYKFYIQFVCSY